MSREIIKNVVTPNGDAMVDDTNDALRVNMVAGSVTVSGADGAILDGASASIKATVLDYTSANPLAVRLSDTNGDYVAAGAGTQYTEDAAAAANPIGSALIVVRDDARAGTLVSADGDNIALRGTNSGEVYVKHVDAIPVTDNSGSLTVDGSVTVTQGTGTNLHMVVDSGTVSTITNVVHVDDNASSLTVDNTGTFAVQAAQSGTWTVQPGNTANTTAWKVDASSVAVPITDNAGSITVDGTVSITSNSAVNVAQMNGVATTMGNGASGTGVQRVTIASDSTGIVQPVPGTSGGLSTFMASGSDGSSILVATAQAAKASAGQLYGYYLYNPESAATFVHFYNTASGSVTVGTTNPLFTLVVPATSGANLMFTHGVVFDTAITLAATTTAGGNTAPATGVSAVVWYK